MHTYAGMAKFGRPTKLTPEVKEAIVNQIRIGNYIETAALVAGISKQSLYDWLKRGREAKRGIYKDFLDAVEQAQAEAEARDLSLIDEAGHGMAAVVIKESYEKNKEGQLVLIERTEEKRVTKDWRAIAWRLEKKHPKKYGKQSKLEITATIDKEQADAIARLQD